MDKNKLGKKMRLARVELGYSQTVIAKAAKLTQKSISRFETGKSFPTLTTLEKLARILKKPYEYFLDDYVVFSWKSIRLKEII